MNKTDFIKKSYNILKQPNNFSLNFNLSLKEFNKIESILWFKHDLEEVKKHNEEEVLLLIKNKTDSLIANLFNHNKYSLNIYEILSILELKENFLKGERFAYIPLFLIYYLIIDKYKLKGNKKTIYRVEVDGIGIYKYIEDNNIQSLIKQFKKDEMTEKTPLPKHDGLLRSLFDVDFFYEKIKTESFSFGFKSIYKLRKWFDCSIIDYINSAINNVKIIEYEIDENYILNSEKQSCFYLSKSKKIKEYSLI